MVRTSTQVISTILALTVVVVSGPMHAQESVEPAMQKVAELPGDVTTMLVAHDGTLYFVSDGRLVVYRDRVHELDEGPIGGAAIGVDGSIYYTRDDRVLRASREGTWKPEDVTEDFGVPAGAGRVVRGADGRLWVEGASRVRIADGTVEPVPEYSGANALPIPSTRDLFANYWTLAGKGSQTELLVLPANAPEAWQQVPFPADSKPEEWSLVLGDDSGRVWIGGTGGLQQLNPHVPDDGWLEIPGAPDLHRAAPTALALSPEGMAMIGAESGQVIEVNMSAAADVSLKVLSAGAAIEGPAQAMVTDGDGNVWVASGRGLYRIEARVWAWQKQWQALGRLPGGNHDIFAAVLDGKLYTSGGATAGWGYPAVQHLFDELWAYDPAIDVWQVVGRMPFVRCYNGIAALAGEIWNVGGAVQERVSGPSWGPRLPLADVDVYNPSTNSWRSGPPMLTPRQEPVVVTANGRIYAIGGASADEALDSVESIGPGDTEWRAEPPMPQPMRQFAGCALDGIVYVVSKAAALSFNPETGDWEALPPAPQLPQASQIAAHDGEVWVLGSYNTDKGYRYSPVDRTWRPAPDLPSPNSWGAAAELDGRLIVAGGAHWEQYHFTFDDRMYALRPDWQRRGR